MVCQLLKLIVKGTQGSNLFQYQIKYAFVHAWLSSIDIHYVSNNKIKKLHGCMTNPALMIKLWLMSKDDLHVYHVFYSTVTGFKKSRNFASIQRTLVTNFIGSIIG